MSEKLFNEISNYGIVPVIALNNVEDAIPLAQALVNGGLPVAEVTFRTEAAQESIRLMAETFPEMLVGAGTVLTIKQVDQAVAAGSQFIVSPGLNPKIVKYCQSINIPIIPGIATPSDLELAIELGLDNVKFFPAEVNGGIKAIKAMSAPYGNVKFMPTGGVNEDNLKAYLSFEKILACGGTWMVKSDLIDNKQFDEIEKLTKDAVSKMLDIKLDHIGFASGSDRGLDLSLLKNILRSDEINADNSRLVDNIELKSSNEIGHLGFSCTNVERAIFHLEKTGVEFDYDSTVYDSKNKLELIYVKGRIADFAVRLIRK